MIIVLKPGSTEAEIDHIVERIKDLGLKAHLSKGEHRTIIGVIGDENKLQAEPLQAIEGVEQVLPIMKPFKLASRDFHKKDTVVKVGRVRVGGGAMAMIAGPCAIESREVLDEIAGAVKASGANILRGGAFKPRTSPYSFQGLGEEGLKILREIGDKHDMPVVTEVMDPRQVPLVLKYADMFQIGARNMQNFDLLKEVGQTRLPVLMKRGMSATVKDLLMSAEYILAEGNPDVVLCERGVRSFEDSTRNMLDLSAVPNVKGMSHLPIIVDPSHATGRPDLIPPMACAAVAAGADGVHVEVHSCPEKALSDGPQALLPKRFAELMERIRALAQVVGKTFEHWLTQGLRGFRMRSKFIAGNWKMYTSGAGGEQLAVAVVKGMAGQAGAGGSSVQVALCPPFPYLGRVAGVLKGSQVALGAQNLYPEKEGAFTGEVSPAMLVDIGCQYCIVGHSERRHGLGESDFFLNRKVHAGLAAGLKIIYCIGETLKEREANLTEKVLDFQVTAGLVGITADTLPRITLAYEPVWAIGTGKNATPEQAQDAHAFIRRRVAQLCGQAGADKLIIQYGGSVKSDNAATLLRQPDVDGALVGGASLKPADFLAIVQAAGQPR